MGDTDLSQQAILNRQYTAFDTTNVAAITEDDGLSFLNITTSATYHVKDSPGVLVRVIFNKPVASSVTTIYDNTTSASTKVATITNPGTLLSDHFVYQYGVTCATGINVVTSGLDDITVVYR